MIKQNLSVLLPLARDAKIRAENLFHNIKLKRVTHTMKTFLLLVRTINMFRRESEDQISFLKELSHALYQSQKGPTEITPYPNGEVFIQGTFSVDRLRTYLLVSKPLDTIELEIGEVQ